MKSLTVSEEASVVTELPAHLWGKTLTLFEATQVFYVDFQCDNRGKKFVFPSFVYMEQSRIDTQRRGKQHGMQQDSRT